MPENASTIVQGLYVMVMGMGIVFAALIMVMLAIMALDRIFRTTVQASAPESKPEPLAAPPPRPVAPTGGPEGDLVAAIALAIALRVQESETAFSPAPVHVIAIQDKPSLWAAAGRLHKQ